MICGETLRGFKLVRPCAQIAHKSAAICVIHHMKPVFITDYHDKPFLTLECEEACIKIPWGQLVS
jgi:hypothetical protein